jgi:hypothetical protein
MNALRIEINYKEWNKKWDLKIGDLSGGVESLNISFENVIDDIKNEMNELKKQIKSQKKEIK